jgi:oligopeptide/dipeptide ABC transporter ATP-binding protein
MYLGKIVEYTDKQTLFTNPLHPYTEALLAAVPIPNPQLRRKKQLLQGDVPSPIIEPSVPRGRARRFLCRFPFAPIFRWRGTDQSRPSTAFICWRT